MPYVKAGRAYLASSISDEEPLMADGHVYRCPVSDMHIRAHITFVGPSTAWDGPGMRVDIDLRELEYKVMAQRIFFSPSPEPPRLFAAAARPAKRIKREIEEVDVKEEPHSPELDVKEESEDSVSVAHKEPEEQEHDSVASKDEPEEQEHDSAAEEQENDSAAEELEEEAAPVQTPAPSRNHYWVECTSRAKYDKSRPWWQQKRAWKTSVRVPLEDLADVSFMLLEPCGPGGTEFNPLGRPPSYGYPLQVWVSSFENRRLSAATRKLTYVLRHETWRLMSPDGLGDGWWPIRACASFVQLSETDLKRALVLDILANEPHNGSGRSPHFTVNTEWCYLRVRDRQW